MASRSIGTASISFGLVTVPVRIYPAVRVSAGISFHFLHKKDGARLKQQYVCSKDGQVVPRSETTRGYEFAKGRYVSFTTEELKALDEKATNGIEIAEFVPADAVDPVYFETSYYLGPDAAGAKAYSLLADAMQESRLAALARYAARGKDYLVLLRSTGKRLVMQQLYHADEVREIADVPVEHRDSKPAEMKLARELITRIATDEFRPERYGDEVRKRVEALIARKVKGHDITEDEAVEKPRAKVVDLMEALRASLASGGHPAKVRAGRSSGSAPSSRRPAARASASRAKATTKRAHRAARRSRSRR